MSMEEASQILGREIRQERGRKTYDTLIATGFRLLEEREFDEITIADLAREAGYSVGAFYARFHSKDEFLSALVAQHIEYRNRVRDRMFANADRETLAEDLVRELVGYYWNRRRFWRAALLRGMRDPVFWTPFHEQGKLSIDALIARLSGLAGRALTSSEQANIRYALQITLGMINNAIVNAGGDLRAMGTHGDRPWRVAVRQPGGGNIGSIQVIGDEAIFTSGNYERFSQDQTQRYPHIIDPATGWPAKDIASVTVISDEGILADAAATALVVAGLENWPAVARNLNLKEIAVVDEHGTVYMTPEMEMRLEFIGDVKRVIIKAQD